MNREEKLVDSMWASLVEEFGEAKRGILDPHAPGGGVEMSFKEIEDTVDAFSKGLYALGLRRGDRVSLFSENGSRWLLADQGIMRCGAADAVRGISSSSSELLYILQSSNSVGLVVQDVWTLRKISEGVPLEVAQRLKFVVVLWMTRDKESSLVHDVFPCGIKFFENVVDLGKTVEKPLIVDGRTEHDLATLVYTSGTTAEPKGVKLTHANILYQVKNFKYFVHVLPDDRSLSVLPPWHIYERSAAYFIFNSGATMVYTNVRKLKEDLQQFPSEHFVCVPLILDTLRSRILAALRRAGKFKRFLAMFLMSAAIKMVQARRLVLGTDISFAIQKPGPVKRFASLLKLSLLWPLYVAFQALVAKKIRHGIGIKKTIISGGGSLGSHLDDFYEAIGIEILNGWGLTECSPVLACRSIRPRTGNIRGTVGREIPGTTLRVVDGETFKDVPDGKKGVILAKGPGVFSGYDGNEKATRDSFYNSWFITGDIGWRVPQNGGKMDGCIVLQGRAKDTIVLLNGENVEPAPLEDNICRCPFIKFAILIGSGHRSLGALIVPNSEALAEEAARACKDTLSPSEISTLIWEGIHEAVSERPAWEKIVAISVLEEDFNFENGTLTRTMKPRRPAIFERYAAEIKELEKHIR